jgi:hypothetical protein
MKTRPNVLNINILLFLLIFISCFSCAKTDPVTGEKILIETDPNKRAREAVEKGGGIFGDLGKSKTSNTFDFATSNPLWRATLKSLDFLPLVNADYSGGVIIYDWYSENLNSKEQIKISIKFLSSELRSDSIQVTSHKRICDENNKCSVSKLNDNFSNEVKETILITARNIKIEEAKKEKK